MAMMPQYSGPAARSLTPIKYARVFETRQMSIAILPKCFWSCSWRKASARSESAKRSEMTGSIPVASIAAIKLILHPLLCYLVLSAIGDFDPVWVYTAVLLAGLPTATNVFVIAQQYGVWTERASASVLITTVLSVFTVTDEREVPFEEMATAVVEAARERLKGVLVFDYVVPDYYARRPKSCMGGWGRQFLNVTPSGKVLPCHAAETIPGLKFDSVSDLGLQDIWEKSEAFQFFRGTGWMHEPCRSCDRRRDYK